MRQAMIRLLATAIIFLGLTVPSSGAPLLLNSIVTTIERPSDAALYFVKSIGSMVPVDRLCLALALYHEARGEPLEGQKAVGLTILNRVASKAYPPTICGVVFQNFERFNKCQFSFTCDRRDNTPGNPVKFAQMIRISDQIIASVGPQSGADGKGPAAGALIPAQYLFATHYHRHDVHPSWSKKLEFIARIGDHNFFKSNRVVRRMSETTVSRRAGILCGDICMRVAKQSLIN